MSDMMSLNVTGFKGKTFPVLIAKDAQVDELYKKVFEKLSGGDMYSDALILFSTDRELSRGKSHKLSDYQLVHGSTITVGMRVKGGSSRLTPIPGLISVTYDEPDMISLDDSYESRAKMPCGHVIGQSSMRDHCRNEVRKGRYRFPCPASNCTCVWEYFLVRHVACFDDATRSDVEKDITENYISHGRKYQQCPGCNTWCSPLKERDIRLQCPACSVDKTFEFCWTCQREWKGMGTKCCGNDGCDGKDQGIRILSAAERKSIDGIPNCPSIRACPKCGLLISLKEGCRHMTCTNCKAEFCFICLEKWRTGHRLSSCQVAPVQSTLTDPLWDQRTARSQPSPPPGNNDVCVIL